MSPSKGRTQRPAIAAEDAEDFARDMVDASEVIEVLAKQMAEDMMAVFRAHAIQMRERAKQFAEAAAADTANDV